MQQLVNNTENLETNSSIHIFFIGPWMVNYKSLDPPNNKTLERES